MNVTLCARCGIEIGYYEGWRVTLAFANDPSPPIEPRTTGLICGDCAAPALQVVNEVASGEHCIRRFKEVAA